MSTLPIHSAVRNIPAGWSALPCSQCGTAIIVRADAAYTPCCRSCRRGEAEREVGKLREIVRDLIRGADIFNVLSQAERQEVLNGLGISCPAKRITDEAPAVRLASLATVDDPRHPAWDIVTDRLLDDIADEPMYDSGGYEPTPEERNEIEGQIEVEQS